MRERSDAAGVTLTGVEFTETHAEFTVSIDGRIAVDPALQALGSCSA